MIARHGIAAVLIAGLLAACSSVPLGTMWKLSRMGPEALFEADPTSIRAAARSERWFLDQPGFDAGTLKVEIRSPSVGDRDWSFALEEVSDREAWRLDPAPAGQRWRMYRIAPSDLEAFQGLQRELPDLIEAAKASEGQNRFSLSVQFGTDALRDALADAEAMREPDSVRDVPYRVDLQLNEEDGFFTLLRDDDLEVPIHSDGDGGDEEADDGNDDESL